MYIIIIFIYSIIFLRYFCFVSPSCSSGSVSGLTLRLIQMSVSKMLETLSDDDYVNVVYVSFYLRSFIIAKLIFFSLFQTLIPRRRLRLTNVRLRIQFFEHASDLAATWCSAHGWFPIVAARVHACVHAGTVHFSDSNRLFFFIYLFPFPIMGAESEPMTQPQ